MAKTLNTDLCVIGAGSGGLSVAAGASQMGASVVLVEKGLMGGDCLNFGCVPSKALLAAGHAAEAVRGARRFGVGAPEPEIDGRGVLAHVRRTIDAIAPMDSVARFEGLGVTVIRAAARFTGPRDIVAGDTAIRARRTVVATGSTAQVPGLPGLDGVPYLTNETVFDGPDLPDHLVIIGGGPIGVELAQAHRNLGCGVTIVEMGSILRNDDAELADVVRQRLIGQGVRVLEETQVTAVARDGGGVAVSVNGEGAPPRVTGSHLLVATGRRPGVDGLDLEAGGIAYDKSGIKVDARLRTTNRKAYAVGDVTGRQQFTHVAGYHAGIVLRNALFRLPAKVDDRSIPWVTYTDPELAQVGLTEKAARSQGKDFRVLRWSLAENDRATAEAANDGLIKVIVTPRGRILGAGIAGRAAGELIQTWCLAIQSGLRIGKVASMIAPYPTLGEIGKRAAGSYYAPSLFSDRTRRIVRFLARFG